MGAFRGLKVTQDSTAVSESSMWKPKILRQRLVCLRRSCQYSERFLIEVNCNVEANTPNRMENHRKKSKQKVYVLTTGITAVWEVMQKNTEERRYVHHEKNNRV